MLEQVWQRLDSGARLVLPLATTLLCTLLSVIAWPLPHFGAVAPPLGLMALYYWTIHRPDLFHPSMAFAVGLLNDILNSLPLGLSALLFVAVHQMVLRGRRFFAGHSFSMMWIGFILTIVIVTVIEWFLLCLIAWKIFPFGPVLLQCILAIIVFPIPCWLFIRLHRVTLSSN